MNEERPAGPDPIFQYSVIYRTPADRIETRVVLASLASIGQCGSLGFYLRDGQAVCCFAPGRWFEFWRSEKPFPELAPITSLKDGP